jgi:pantoate--beta-alanine ligase
MNRLTIPHDVRILLDHWRKNTHRIGFVPTMGALHAGHLRLVDAARQSCDAVVVSIFVNPLQFGAGEDFSRYPRETETDAALLHGAGADLLYTPSVGDMYPDGFATTLHIDGHLTATLCGAHRPGHFDGMATVVAKLLHQVEPDMAFFGEKDYQQLCVIRRLVRDLDLRVQVTGVPTVREVDGLALSSRNRYLNDSERAIAPELYGTLLWAHEHIFAARLFVEVAAVVEEARRRLRTAGFSKVDYVQLLDADSLLPPTRLDQLRQCRLFAAAILGKARLIDNLAMATDAS